MIAGRCRTAGEEEAAETRRKKKKKNAFLPNRGFIEKKTGGRSGEVRRRGSFAPKFSPSHGHLRNGAMWGLEEHKREREGDSGDDEKAAPTSEEEMISREAMRLDWVAGISV